MQNERWTEQEQVKRRRTAGLVGNGLLALAVAAILLVSAIGCKDSPPRETPARETRMSVEEYLDSLFDGDPGSQKEFERIQGEFRTGKHAQAFKDLQALLEGSPQAPWAEAVEFYRAQALTALRKYGHAVRQLDALLQKYPDSPAVPRFLIGKAQIYLALGNLRRAQEDEDPLGGEYLRKAKGIFQQVSRDHSNDPDVGGEALFYVGETALSLGETAEAEKAFRRVVGAYRDSPQAGKALYALAGLHLSEADVVGAEEAFKEITERFPKTRLGRKAEQKLQGIRLIDSPAPPLQIKEWIGEPPPEGDLYPGRVTLLSFWAIWCPHCKRNIPKMERLSVTYGDRGVSVVGVTREKEGQGADKVREFVESRPMRFPTGIDDDGRTSKAMAVKSIPCVVAVDARGRIRWHGHPDHLSDKVVEGLLEQSS